MVRERRRAGVSNGPAPIDVLVVASLELRIQIDADETALKVGDVINCYGSFNGVTVRPPAVEGGRPSDDVPGGDGSGGMSADTFPLFHWSPESRRTSINRYGFRPSSRSVDGLWRPPFVCFSSNPELAWILSGKRFPGSGSWDLWMTWSDVPTGYEKIIDNNPGTGRTYVKEYRVYERIWKRDVWYVGSRII